MKKWFKENNDKFFLRYALINCYQDLGELKYLFKQKNREDATSWWTQSQRIKMTTDNYTPAYEGPIKQMKEILRTFNLPQINHVETKFQHIYT